MKKPISSKKSNENVTDDQKGKLVQEQVTPTPGSGSPTGDSDELYIVCVNCMKMIRLSLVNEHSSSCIQVNSEVKLMEGSSQSRQADFKIHKLMESLETLRNDSTLMNKAQNNSYYLTMLSTYAEDLYGIVDYTKTDILSCREVVCNLKSLCATYKGATPIRIYMDRLASLAMEKYTEMLKYFCETAEKQPGMKIEKSSSELMKEFEQRCEVFRKSKNNAIDMRVTFKSEKSAMDEESPFRGSARNEKEVYFIFFTTFL